MRRQPITPIGVVALIVLIGVVSWMRWQREAPAAIPSSSPASTTSAPASPPPTNVAGYDLTRDERLGGHTLARHVGRSDDELRERLRREPDISAASTYTDRATAERVIATTLDRERRRVEAWLARPGNRPNLGLDYRGAAGDVIGRTVRRGAAPRPCVDAVVVLQSSRDGGFIVRTSYPEAR